MTTPLEGALAQTLDAVAWAAPLPSADLEATVTGRLRQRRRSRRVVAAGLATVLVLVGITAAVVGRGDPPRPPAVLRPMPATLSPTPCRASALPIPPSLRGLGYRAGAAGVDPTGRYVVGSVGAWVVLWVDGQVGVVDTRRTSHPMAVNSAGTVVGYSDDGAWVYRGGHLTPLAGLPEPGQTSTRAINSRGDIVGETGAHAVLWPADDLAHPRAIGDAQQVNSITDDGFIAGFAMDGARHVWSTDGIALVPPPGFQPDSAAGVWVLGEIGTGLFLHSARWNRTTGAVTPLLVNLNGSSEFTIGALSASGAVVIQPSAVAGSGPVPAYAVLRGATVTALVAPDGHPDVTAGGISADGRTVVGSDGTSALIWHC